MWPTGVSTSSVYDYYWRFAAARQEIFWKRAEGQPGPWSTDPIFNTFKFTCPYRVCDRVSQYLLTKVIYDGQENTRSLNDTFFRIILFKLFNLPSTWDLIEGQLGEVKWEKDVLKDVDAILTSAGQRGDKIFTGAYLMCGKLSKGEPKHRAFLRILQYWMESGVPEEAARGTMEQAFHLFPTKLIADFLSYQFVTDLNYSPLYNWDEMSFTVSGWGSRRGIEKIFTFDGRYSKWPWDKLIRGMAERQEEEFDRLGLDFKRIAGNRPLQLIDCQNLFCETDKYLRVARPEITTVTIPRTRMKKKFEANPNRINYFYPPKWISQ